jgi:hypothetical protein
MFLRLRQIALVARDLDPAVANLHEVLGIDVAFRDPGVASFGLHNAVMPAGQQFIEIVAPIEDNTAAGRYLDRRDGDGGYMVILQCDDHGPVKQRVDELGVRKVVEQDSKHYKIMQLHPRDTGGSFLEIDVQEGGESMDGPWEPAGPNWQAARTGVVTGIVAAEIQSDEPEALATRWSNILDRPVVTDDEGRATVALDNATLRFVAAQDGRGEGLAGIDVAVVSPDDVLKSGDETGKRLADDVVLVDGMRMRVVPA